MKEICRDNSNPSGGDSDVLLFSTLLSSALARPLDAVLWGMLGKIAPTIGAGMFFSQYSAFLHTKKVKRSYTLNGTPYFEDKRRVTFVMLSPAISTRVEKVARTATLAGLQVQLILCFKPDSHFYLTEANYEQVLVMEQPLWLVDTILSKVMEFGSSIIHLFVDCITNLEASVWAFCSPLPVVGDPYDTCCAQYEAWPHAPEALKRNVLWEEMWMRHVDGLCIRALYMKTKSLQSIYRKGMPVYHMPDPARRELCIRNMDNIDDSRIDILLDGLAASDPWHKNAFTEIFDAASKAGNVSFHVYRYDGEDLSRYGEMVKVYPRLPVDEFARLMRSCGAFVQPWCMEYVKRSGYSAALAKYSTRNTASDIMEADIVSVLPDYFELLVRNACKSRRGIAFSHEEQCNSAFWRSLPARVAQLRRTPPCYERFQDATMARHLFSFYHRVISNAGNACGQ